MRKSGSGFRSPISNSTAANSSQAMPMNGWGHSAASTQATRIAAAELKAKLRRESPRLT